MIELRLLGPFEVRRDGQLLSLTTNRLRALLATMALSACDVVSLETFATAVWGHHLPHSVANSVQAYVARLRRVLGTQVIETRGGGYALRVDPEHVDVLRFVRLSSVTPGTPGEQADLEAALGLWRGSPFEGIVSTSLSETMAPGLVERYLATVERWVDLALEAGRADDVVAQLREVASRHPLHEPLWARLITALNRSGQPGEALDCYDTIRSRIANELGADPGPELQRVRAQMLQWTNNRWTPPRSLPPNIPCFIGRLGHLATLDELVFGSDVHEPVLVAVIHGAGGIGKTALVIHWAHRARNEFPDGQLLIDLHGHGPIPPVHPAVALEALLRSLGVHSDHVPHSMDARSAMLRSLLAGKRALILLDNARDSAQVRPLLPGSTCRAIVTSRSRLRGLGARDGAYRMVLDEPVLDDSEVLPAGDTTQQVVAMPIANWLRSRRR